MKKLKKKLKSLSGETLTETLAALLIAALALTMLAGAISASSNVINKSRDRLEKYYEANEEPSGVVQRTTGTSVENGITITAEGISSQTSNVAYYENDKFSNMPVIAYKYLTPSPTPAPFGG